MPEVVAVSASSGTAAWHVAAAVSCGGGEDLAQAEHHARAALKAAPGWVEAHAVLASVLVQQDRLTEAIAAYETVVHLAPAEPIAHLLLANACLRAGAWLRGWPELEWRLATPQGNRRRVPPEARWRGEDLRGGTLLVHAPDGAGDAILCARYLPAAVARCGRVVLVAEAGLIPLLRQVPGVDLAADEPAALPAYDRFVDRLSLPGIFATTPARVPAPSGYLRAEPARAGRWAATLPAGRKIGLVWATHPGHPGHAERSLPVEALAPVIACGGFVFVNLQVGAANADGARLGLSVNPARDVSDYADTAAIMTTLELVISADTAACHLAGALGVPVWTVLPRAAEWRWMVRRADSPWYQSMRLFRRRAGEATWDGVAARLAAALPALQPNSRASHQTG